MSIDINPRTVEDTVAGTAQEVLINGVPYSPKRLKVYQVHELMNEKKERIMRVQLMQRQAIKLQKIHESGNTDNMSIEDAMQYAQEAQMLAMDVAFENSVDSNLWLLDRLYPEAKESGDLQEITEEEYAEAINAIFKVNPSLGKSREAVLMNPLMNQNG